MERNLDLWDERVTVGEDLQMVFAAVLDARGVCAVPDYYPYHYWYNMASMTGGHDPAYLQKIKLLRERMEKISDEKGVYDFRPQIRNDFLSLAVMAVKNEIWRNHRDPLGKVLENVSAMCRDASVQEALRNHTMDRIGLSVRLYIFMMKHGMAYAVIKERKMERKLIFLDIDGTILIPGMVVRREVMEGLRRARNRGHQIFICTGRAVSVLPAELDDLTWDGVIASAGSDIWIHGQNVYRGSLEVEQIRKASRLLEGFGAVYVLEGYDHMYVCGYGRKLLLDQVASEDLNPEMVRWRNFFRQKKNVRSFEEWDPDQTPIPKVTFMLWGKEYLEKLESELKDDFYMALFQTGSGDFFNGELISLKDNKGTAVRRTADLLKADIKDTIAFGDSMNDYQMIEMAEVGVAMGNADEKVKKIADRVCESVEEDGVIRELERMGIC